MIAFNAVTASSVLTPARVITERDAPSVSRFTLADDAIDATCPIAPAMAPKVVLPRFTIVNNTSDTLPALSADKP